MFKRLYFFIEKAESYLQSPLLLLIRIYWGWGFFVAGSGKFYNLEGVTEFFTSLGIPFPYLSVLLVATVESVGGILFLLGVFTPIVTLLLGSVMVTAFLTAHIDAVKMVFQQPGILTEQTPFLYLYAVLMAMAFGPGKFSIDYWFRCRFCRN